MKTRIILLLIPLLFVIACSSAEQTTEQQEKKSPEVYVFDDVSKVDTTKIPFKEIPEEKPAVKNDTVISAPAQTVTTKQFIVQVGAFTSKERAEGFIRENQSRTSLPLSISFNGQTKLFAVQVPPYNTKEEADIIRDNLRKFPVFKDAFTVTVEK